MELILDFESMKTMVEGNKHNSSRLDRDIQHSGLAVPYSLNSPISSLQELRHFGSQCLYVL